MSDDTRAILEALKDLKQPEPEHRRIAPSTLGWAGLVLAILPLLVTVTAYVAPLSDEVQRVEAQIEQVSEDAMGRSVRTNERVDRIEEQAQTAQQQTQVALAQIQSDISVIKAQIAPTPTTPRP